MSNRERIVTIEDPGNETYYRLGASEYIFASLLDGRTPLSEAIERTNAAHSNKEMTAGDAIEIVAWLLKAGLATSGGQAPAAGKSKQQLWNPVAFKVPLGNPDAVLTSLTPWFKWWFSPWSAVLWVALILLGAYRVGTDWSRFAATTQIVCDPTMWIWLALIWVVLKVIHEISHGVACKKYGGSVPQCGLFFLLFAPLAFVDTTSSWRISSPWKRAFVAAAGMYTDLALAAVAAVIWSFTSSGPVNSLCFGVISTAGVSTLLFNANPLMRFDGYHMLSDLLRMPTLYSDGQRRVLNLAKRYLLGVAAVEPRGAVPRLAFVTIYGFMSAIWKVLVCVGLVLAASALFHGAGLILAIIAALLWFALPAMRFAKYLMFGNLAERPGRLRFALVVVLPLGFMFLAAQLLPWPAAKVAPVVVQCADLHVVHTQSEGFVRNVCKESGDLVERGDVIFTLQNDSLHRELADLRLALQQSELKRRILQRRNQLAALQAEEEQHRKLRTELQEKQRQVDGLVVRAPTAGRLYAGDLASAKGTFLQTGTEVFSVGDDLRKELKISISQSALDDFRALAGQEIQVRFPNGDNFASRLVRIAYQGSDKPPHAAMLATNGGPLTVRRTIEDRANASEPLKNVRLIRPRFTGTIRLDPSTAKELRPGQSGTALCGTTSESIWDHLCNTLARWAQVKRSAQHDAES